MPHFSGGTVDNSSLMAKERLIWADSLKGWLMVLVIIGHAIQSLLSDGCNDNHVWNLIYSFHMPAFMAVSGWLAYRGMIPKIDYISTVKRRGMQLLIPYFVWSSIQFVLSGSYSIENLSKMILYPDAYLWFLWVLFWICVLFNLAQLISEKCKINEIITIGCFCAILLVLMVGAEIRMFGFQFLAYYFLFYTLGYCLHKYDWKLLSSWTFLVPSALLWFFLAWGWTMHGLPSWLPAIPHVPSTLLQYAYRGFTALVSIVVLIGAAPKLLNGKGKLNTFISGVGIISLGMYTGHLLFLGLIKRLLLYLSPAINTWLAIIIISVIIFILAHILIKLLEKNKNTARIFLGKI